RPAHGQIRDQTLAGHEPARSLDEDVKASAGNGRIRRRGSDCRRFPFPSALPGIDTLEAERGRRTVTDGACRKGYAPERDLTHRKARKERASFHRIAQRKILAPSGNGFSLREHECRGIGRDLTLRGFHRLTRDRDIGVEKTLRTL